MRFAYTVFATFTIAAVLPASTITVGRPYADGTLDLNVDGTLVTVEITKAHEVTKGHPENYTTAEDKVALIGKVMTSLEIKYSVGQSPDGSPTVTPDEGKVKLIADNTNERVKLADAGISLPNSPVYASLGFTGPLSPLSTDGAESTFSASFGIDGSPFASASLTYSQLSAGSSNALLADIFAILQGQLPDLLRPALSLDLAAGTLTFAFPTGAGEYCVETSTTSPGTSQSRSLQSTPEPATFLTLSTTLILAGIWLRRPTDTSPFAARRATKARPVLQP